MVTLELVWEQYRTPIIFIIVTLVVLVTPVIRYVRIGWLYKRDDILNSIGDEGKQIYLAKFQKMSMSNPAEAKVAFYSDYYRRFGRQHFIIPILVLIIIGFFEASLAIESLVHPQLSLWSPKFELNPTALAAMAGAYMWVVSDFISRARRMDFSPADILWGSLRLFIAAPLGLSLSAIVEPGIVSFIAFGLGAFPLDAIQTALRQLSADRLKIQLGANQESQLLHLDGVDQTLVDRLSHEDITSIVQLAYCDPIQLTMRSNLSFNAVVDLVSQSLAWTYIAEKLNEVRPLGLRGAYEFRELCEDIQLPETDPKSDAARQILPTVAERLGLGADNIHFVMREIAYDPYTDFIFSAWG